MSGKLIESLVENEEVIISQKQRGRQMGNLTLFSLRSLRLHDPYSCVTYAVKRHLTGDPDWCWTKDFINDTKEYTRLIDAVMTTKAMGPKYKCGVQIPRSVRYAFQLDKKNGNNLW